MSIWLRGCALACALICGASLCGETAAEFNSGKAINLGPAVEANWVDGRWSQTDVGPFLTCVLPIPGGHIRKGISIKVGENAEAAVCFDSGRVGVRAAWYGNFLKFDGARYGLIKWPKPAGDVFLACADGPCWGAAKVRYSGLRLNGNRVVLGYMVDGTEVRESPWLEKYEGTSAITRTFRINPNPKDELCALGDSAGAWTMTEIDRVSLSTSEKAGVVTAVAVKGGSGAALKADATHLVLAIPAHDNVLLTKVLMWSGKKDELPKFAALVKQSPRAEDIALHTAGAPRWSAPIETKGALSTEAKPYVVDTFTVPYDNPFKALFFLSGVDFFDNGDAAVCSLHGDVWRVRGLDGDLSKVTWQRYATGLFEPLGLKMIGGKAYVLGRDQITILQDLNDDGEADYYENFNNDSKTDTDGHFYSACLETDAAGNFYHVDPFGLHRISKDGSKYETLAEGWRNPISMAVGPGDVITVSPQQGNWTPSSSICEVRPGGWYGYAGPKKTDARPLGYDAPLCYMPHSIDNSTGGHLWVNSDKWGPFNNQLLNLSFGQGVVQLVLREVVDGQPQGGVTTFPLRFLSGAIRGRFRPQDGQLYVVGTKGWQTTALRDGSFQRVRYTGAPVVMPGALNVHANGIRVTFTAALDRKEAEDADNYSAAQWNYRYSGQYGSDDWSAATPDKKGRDDVAIKSAKLSADGKSIYLEIADLKPVMQMQLKYRIKSSDGAPVRGEIHNTINKVGPAWAK